MIVPTPTDAQLLDRYVADGDHRAFEAIVRKHGPMVFAACRRIAGRWHDAEDAFQACFLVLAAKAETVRPQSRLGAWLHGVAVRCALKARRLARSGESPLPDLSSSETPGIEPDVASLLDEALAAIPDKYRAAVVLCHLQGRTRTEAARELGWTEGTLSGRLHRAMGLLAKRLAARGVTATGAAGLAMVSARAASASVPAKLFASTNAAAAVWSAGFPEPAGATATALAHGVIRTMMFRKVKVAAGALVFVLGALALATAGRVDARAHKAPVPRSVEKEWGALLFTLKHPAAVTAVAHGKDRIATADAADGQSVSAWDAATGKNIRQGANAPLQPGNAKPVRWIQFLAEERTILFAGDGGTSPGRLDVDNGDARGVGEARGVFPTDIRFTSASEDGTTWVGMSTKEQTYHATPCPILGDRNGNVSWGTGARADTMTQIIVSANGNRLAVATTAPTLDLCDFTDHDQTWTTIPLPKGTTLTALALSRDGTRAAAVGTKGFARVYNAEKGKELCTLNGLGGTASAVALTPDGTQVAVAHGKTVSVFDAESGALLGELKGHTDDVTCLTFAPGGKRLVTGSKDKTAMVWERK
jgi:RNA polymerase sigma factor (sigma-70 family)